MDMTSYFAVGAPIWTKFRRLMHNNMQITANWSRSKPEVELQYGGRLYFETGSSYISAAKGHIFKATMVKVRKLYLSRQFRYLDKIWFANRL